MADEIQGITALEPSPVVGVRIPQWATFTRHIFGGILEHLRLRHKTWRLHYDLNSTQEMAPVKIDRHWSGDGLIVFRPSMKELEAWRAKGIPVVNISSESAWAGLPSVIPDNLRVGRMAADHLLGLGLKEFAFWGDPSRRYSQERFAGFSQQLGLRGAQCTHLGFEISKLPGRGKWLRVEKEMLGQLAALPLPIGIFARDDIGAAALASACAKRGLRIPDDVALLGCNDDVIFCHTSSPPLSSIRYPGQQIGFAAAELLERLMQGDARVPDLVTIAPGDLVERESTDVLGIADEAIAKAVRLIRREAPHRPLQVGELITQLHLSRAAFQRRFLAALGHTPKDEIHRVRIKRVRELLATTEWLVKEIAFEMRFGSPDELSRFIRQHLGTSAIAYRQSLPERRAIVP